MHADLYAECIRAARIQGTPVSTFAEKCLISRINHIANAVLLDAIGRYTETPAKGGVALHDLMMSQGRPQEHETDYPEASSTKRDRSPR